MEINANHSARFDLFLNLDVVPVVRHEHNHTSICESEGCFEIEFYEVIADVEVLIRYVVLLYCRDFQI